MTQSARHEEAHYCARCRAIIADEEAAEAVESAPREARLEADTMKDRDSGVIPTSTLRGGVADPAPAPVPAIPTAALPQIEPSFEPESQTEIDVRPPATPDESPTESKIETAPESAEQTHTEPAPESVAQATTEAAPPPAIAPEHELRAAPRRQVEVDVGIHSDSHFFAGLTGDVSRGGLFVATYAKIAVGSKVTLDFELPNGRVVANGTVRWLRSARDHHAPGFGVQFENVEPAMLKLIERFCQARPPLYYDQADDF